MKKTIHFLRYQLEEMLLLSHETLWWSMKLAAEVGDSYGDHLRRILTYILLFSLFAAVANL